jgi:hypothetical protein
LDEVEPKHSSGGGLYRGFFITPNHFNVLKGGDHLLPKSMSASPSHASATISPVADAYRRSGSHSNGAISTAILKKIKIVIVDNKGKY